MWVRVEPIVWKIQNWSELPKEINPNGNGVAEYIELVTEQAIIAGMNFYPTEDDENAELWQNSTIRGYLNGINVNNIKSNGNLEFGAPHGGDFSSGGFLQEAFDCELEKTNIFSQKAISKPQILSKEESFIDEIFAEAQKNVEDEMTR